MSSLFAYGVFALTFVALAAGTIGRVRLERGPIALFGGLLMVMMGALSPGAAVAAIDLATLGLLLGMMLLAAALSEAGLFAWAAGWLALHARSERALVLWTLLGSAVLSGIFLNDTIALLVPPVLLLVLRWAALPTFRTLAACAIGVNLGGLWTPVGTPQNAYLATVHGLPFVGFALHMTPLVLFGLLVAGILLTRGAGRTPLPATPDFATVTRRSPLGLALAALGLTLVMFLFSSQLAMPLWAIALTSGVMVLAMVPFLDPNRSSRAVLARVNGNLLLLFAGLFLLVEGARATGMVDALVGLLPLGGEGIGQIARVTGVTFVASNLFSNVPAVLLLDGVVHAGGGSAFAELLAAASTLSGNTTLLASAATLIVAECAEAEGERFPFWRFTRIGGVVAVVTLLAAVPYFAWLGSR